MYSRLIYNDKILLNLSMKQVLNTYSPWLDMERIYEMNKFVLLFFIFFGLYYPSALRAETILYCKSELATGFFVDKGKEWSEIGFIRKSFTLKFNQDYATSNVAVPARSQVMKCSKPYSFEPQFISCI